MKSNWIFDAGNIIAIIAIMISLLSSGISAWWLFFRNLEITVVLEKKVQVLQGTLPNALTKQLNDVCAFNILAVITTSGSSAKWCTIKFDNAKITFPNDKKYDFECRSYLEECGSGQKNKSRAIPIAIKGGDSITITSAYQTTNLRWIPGNYKVVIEYSIKRASEKKLRLKEFEFTLNEDVAKELTDPKGYFTVDMR